MKTTIISNDKIFKIDDSSRLSIQESIPLSNICQSTLPDLGLYPMCVRLLTPWISEFDLEALLFDFDSTTALGRKKTYTTDNALIGAQSVLVVEQTPKTISPTKALPWHSFVFVLENVNDIYIKVLSISMFFTQQALSDLDMNIYIPKLNHSISDLDQNSPKALSALTMPPDFSFSFQKKAFKTFFQNFQESFFATFDAYLTDIGDNLLKVVDYNFDLPQFSYLSLLKELYPFF